MEGDKYIITWLLSHILSFLYPHDYDPELRRWKAETLPIVPSKFRYKVREIKGKKDPKAAEQYKTIKSLFERSNVREIICATDPGLTGEEIFRETYCHCYCKKPLNVVSKLLGHSKASITSDIYISVIPQLKTDAVKALDLLHLSNNNHKPFTNHGIK